MKTASPGALAGAQRPPLLRDFVMHHWAPIPAARHASPLPFVGYLACAPPTVLFLTQGFYPYAIPTIQWVSSPKTALTPRVSLPPSPATAPKTPPAATRMPTSGPTPTLASKAYASASPNITITNTAPPKSPLPFCKLQKPADPKSHASSPYASKTPNTLKKMPPA